MFTKKLIQLAALTFALFLFEMAVATDTPHHTLPKPISDYIKTLETKYHFDNAELTALFQQVHINRDIINRMNHPYEAKPWHQYRKFFITKQRIEDGVAFWNKNREILEQAEQKYGVPASVVIAIIGVETQYGQYTGNFPVIDTLTTLSFYYQPRAEFFKSELTEFLLLTREQKLKPLALTGSYAGAIGMPQFMPSSYRRYAVDYSEEGSADIIHDSRDAIFSVANYLKKMGWKEKQPVAAGLNTRDPIDEALLSTSAKPKHSVAMLKEKGITLPTLPNNKAKVAIVKLESENPEGADYWLTFKNFRAIMHYNPRINYAMAVYQLSEEINHAYQQTITARAKPTSARTTERRTT